MAIRTLTRIGRWSTLLAAVTIVSAVHFGSSEQPAVAEVRSRNVAPPAPIVVAPPPPVAMPPAPPPVAPPPADAYVIKRVLDTGGDLKHGEWFWDEAGVPAGPVVVTVDLEAQVISVFRGGYEIGAAAIIYGADDKPTPLGVFPITQKKVHHISNLYHVPMPYMQRLTSDGIALHAAPVVEFDVATHGCIGLPKEFAKLVFGATKLGDKVIITRGETLDSGAAITAAG